MTSDSDSKYDQALGAQQFAALGSDRVAPAVEWGSSESSRGVAAWKLKLKRIILRLLASNTHLPVSLQRRRSWIMRIFLALKQKTLGLVWSVLVGQPATGSWRPVGMCNIELVAQNRSSCSFKNWCFTINPALFGLFFESSWWHDVGGRLLWNP